MRKILSLLLVFLLLCPPCYAEMNKPPLGSQINWSHPLAKGLIGGWLVNELTGRNLFAIGKIQGNKIAIKTWRRGNYVMFPNAKDGNFDAISSLLQNIRGLSNGEFSFVINLFCPTSTTATVKYIFTNTAGNYLRVIATDAIVYYRKGYSGQATRTTVANTLTVGAWQQIIVSKKPGSAGTTISIYKNGVECTYSATGNATLPFDPDSTTCRLGTDTSGNNFADFYFSYIYIYDRGLSFQEVKQLHIDPYCFIKRPSLYDLFKTAVAATRRIMFIQ